MTYLNGGYSIIKKDDANIFAKVNDALTSGKPILWYEYATTCYFIDSISKSGDDIVLTKGGKTITITDSNVVTELGSIQNHLYNLSIYFSDTTFNVYTNDKGAFNLDTEYDFVDSSNTYKLSDELTTSLLSILDKIKIGGYEGIPFNVVCDSLIYINRSDSNKFYIQLDDGTDIIEVNLNAKSVITSNSEDWVIKFTKLF